MTSGKLIAFIIIGLTLLVWLAEPGTGSSIALLINHAWSNAIIAVQPIISIAVQVAVATAVIYLIWLFIRRNWRR